jgi:hypothetical protein
MRMSGVNTILRNICLGLLMVFVWCIYTDAGFTNDTNVICSMIGWAFLNRADRECNRIMAKVRVPIEWGFGMIKQECPYITDPNILKLRQGKVSMLMRNAVLLTNIRNLIHGNNTSLFFSCERMSLRDYFA